MPIYAYKCESCGFAKDVLQKISDEPLVNCPTCEKPAFRKQLTAAGFQLKGSGWYVTDFRGGSTSAPATGTASAGEGVSTGSESSKSDAAAPATAAPSTTSSSTD